MPLAQVPIERGVTIDRTRFQELLDAGLPRAEAMDRARIAPGTPLSGPQGRDHPADAPKRIRRVL